MAMAGRECLYLFMEDEVGGAQQALGSEERAEMDGEIWSRLPEDVLSMVLVRVPILSHRRFMCVCRRWRSMLSEPAFARECDSAAAAGTAKACLCCFGGVELAGQQLLRLPHACLRPRKMDPSCLPGGGTFLLDLWASDKGLLCFSKRTQGYGETYLYVCNPVMRMWKALPVLRFEEFEALHRAFIQVAEDRSREREYDVVLLAKTLAGKCRVFIYSSSSSGWKRMEWGVEVPSANREPVLCKGVIHAWRSSAGLEKIEDSSFCIRSGMEVDNMPHPPAAPFRKLVEVEGCLFVVSFLEPFSGISIWKLEEEKCRAWEHVSACPAKDYMRLTASRTPPVVARLKVGVVAGFICLCAEKAMSRPALAYDTRGKTWCTWDFGVADPRSRKKVFPFHMLHM